MDKEEVHIYNEYELAIKENESLPSAMTFMDLEGIVLSEISQRKTKCHDFTYMWNLKNKINKQVDQKQTHKYREHFDGCQLKDGLGGWMKKVKG